IGTPQQDRTSVGMQLANPEMVCKQAATRAMMLREIFLPPHQIARLTNTWELEDDYTLHSLVPHMHVRGRAMRVEAAGEGLVSVLPTVRSCSVCTVYGSG